MARLDPRGGAEGGVSGDPDILMPPEGVPLRFPVAGVGVRIGAQIADILITGFAALAAIGVALFWLALIRFKKFLR